MECKGIGRSYLIGPLLEAPDKAAPKGTIFPIRTLLLCVVVVHVVVVGGGSGGSSSLLLGLRRCLGCRLLLLLQLDIVATPQQTITIPRPHVSPYMRV